MKFIHTMIRVKDLDLALDFFCNKLGLVETRRIESEAGRFSLIYLSTGGSEEDGVPEIELTYNWDNTEDYDQGRFFGHFAFRVENIYETCQKLMDQGVTINRPPRDGMMAFVKSPDGHSVEFLQKGKALEIQEPWASMENIGTW